MRQSNKKIVYGGLLIALVFIATYVPKIPVGNGYVNLGDAAIILAAVLFGGPLGFVAGAFGSALADLVAGYAVYAPVTFIVKGLEGLFIAIIISWFPAKSLAGRITATLIGVSWMVGAYFFSEAFILGAFDSGFGWSSAVQGFIPNIGQAAASVAAGLAITFAVEKAVAAAGINSSASA